VKKSLLLLIGLIFLSGCAGLGRYKESTYYYPDWTLDGKIICVKNITTYERGGFVWGAPTSAPVAQEYYITTMSTQGAEETGIKLINGVGKVAASPLGNYIAYTDGDYIKMITTAGADVSSIDCSGEVNSLDWSSDEEELVYSIFESSISTYEVYLVDRDGTLREFIINGLTVDWRYGTKIVFVNNGYIQLIDPTSKQVTNLLVEGGFPQLSDDNQILYKYYNASESRNEIWTMTTSAESKTRKNEAFNDYLIPKLSPDKLKLVCGESGESGIWVINIDGTGEIKLRD